MRPGPGLVVMALAFISGARRGSTSTSTSSKSSSLSTTTSKSPPEDLLTTSTPYNDLELLSTSLLFPTYLGGGGVSTSTDTNILSKQPQQETERENFRKDDYINTYNSYSYPPPFVPPRDKTTHDDQHLRLETLSGLKSSSRATRQTRIIRSLSRVERNQNENIDGESGNTDSTIGDNVNNRDSAAETESGSGGYESDDGTTSTEDKISEGNTPTLSRVSKNSKEFSVKVASNSPDASQSFDEDDILALVAEDDLLSEESFDRLTKITDDKIGYVIVDDYDVTNEDTTTGASESSLASAAEETHQQLQNGKYTANEIKIDSGISSGGNIHFQNEQEHENGKAYIKANIDPSINGKVYVETIEKSHDSSAVLADPLYVAAFNENGLSHTVDTNTASSARNNKWSIFDSESPLTRLNPWISACDLAQPGTAPDLQGQCSAGTLPVAWVDEGPGPPICPDSCEKLKPNVVNNFKTKPNTDNSNLINNYKVNIKSSIKNHYENPKMSKTRRDLNNLKGNKGNQTSNKDPSFLVAGKSELSRNQLLNRSPDFTVKTEQTNHTSTKVTSVSDNRQEQAETMMPLEYSNYNDFGSKYESNSDDIYKNKQKKQFYGYREQQQQQQQQQQRKEQQCLDYLGDTEETSPAHLCTFKSPSELAVQLRSLRLRHCCERNVFSALHTVALNATLSGGVQCVRTLMDVMDLDLLATRITCEVAEILFRFDCRQVYSLIHQCDDCKEAYRRWVCSTLVPYFAEESDISVSPSYTTKINNNSNKRNNSENDQLNSNKSITKNENTILKGITSNKTSLMFPNVNNKDILNDTANITGVSEQRAKREQNRILANTSPRDNDREVDRNFMQTALKRRRRDVNDKCNWQQQQERQQGKPNNPEQLQQSNIFISTAIKADPCIEDPVISKKIKRSKRKVQFRKRRRIRPCLSVCQTVEQKCPYLLPADRAPALPTQYAGEPTFLCLDQSIPETGEQLRKSSYGPSECCYSYCDNIADGICAYCYEFVQEADSIFTIGNSTRRLHNITITATSQYKLDARLEASLAKDSTSKLAASISIALNNSSATAVGGQIDRLPYYALYDGIYYYDENTSDMPDVAMSDDCPPVPSVTSRCSIPYYASSALPIRLQQKAAVKDVIGHHVLLLLSAMLCLLTSHTAAIQLKHSAHPNQKNRKYLVHGSKPSNIASMLMVSNSKASSPIYTINKCMYLIQHRTECLQQFAGLEDYAVKRKIMRSADCSIPTENPTVPTIFSTYLSEDTYESDTSSIRHYVQDCGRHIVKCLSRYGRVMCRNRSKIKGKKKSRRSYGNQNRNTQESANKITNGKVNRSKTTINKVYSTFKKFNESKISSTKYTGNIRYKHVQMNIGNNIKITYRLNSKLYFNSNTKIYRRKKCSKFRNFNIDTFTDYNNNHTNHIIVAKTSKPHTRTNANRNINKNNNYYIYNSGYNKENYNFDTFKSRNTETHCHLFYYYNFNINDWWRRWWRFSSLPVAQRQRLFIL